MARTVYGRNGANSNAMPSGAPQGTPGGIGAASGRRPGMKLMVGDEAYLWLLLALELFLMGMLRKHFKRHHGG